MIKKIPIGLVAVFVIIQFFHPAKNLSGETNKDISVTYEMPEYVKSVLQRSCNDCHSNKTVYPWYAEIQPVAWWLNSHIEDGKKHFNLNNFMSLKVAVQKKKLEECIEQIENNEMPLGSYTLIHTDAKLSVHDKQMIKTWCQSIIDTIKAKYPADSLVLKRQKWD